MRKAGIASKLSAMKTKTLRFVVIAGTFALFGRFGVTPSRAQFGSSGGGCCGTQTAEEPAKAKNCPPGSTWNAERQVCLEPNGTPRAPLN